MRALEERYFITAGKSRCSEIRCYLCFCGAAVDSDATRIARIQSTALEPGINADLEHTIFSVRPTMLFIKAGYALAVVAGIGLVFLLASLNVSASISIPMRSRWRYRAQMEKVSISCRF